MEKPEPFKYWVKAAMVAAIPRPGDWSKALYSWVEFCSDLWDALGVTIFRLLVLVTFPISIPLLAMTAMRLNRKAVELRNKARAELLESLTRNCQNEHAHDN